MFQEGSYDKIEFEVPVEGMNQFISPEILPKQFAYFLDNIVTDPLGSAQVRYGTQRVSTINNPEATILKTFSFTKPNGGKQAILYTQYYVQDNTIQNPTVNNQVTLTFTSNRSTKYQPDTTLKVVYTFNGSNYTLYGTIQSVVMNNPNIVVIILTDNVFPNGVIHVQSIGYAAGTLYSYDVDTHTLANIPTSELSVACIPRSTYFQQKLLIYNGVDKLLAWDGDTLTQVVDFVKERYANTFNRIDNNNFSFLSIAGFDVTKYFNGNLIQLGVNGVISQLTITNVVVANNLVTITTQEVIPNFDAQHQPQLFYQDWPPPFNYIFASSDRLWALGTGAAGINFRTSDQALRVYYTYEPNTLTNWFNETTKTVPSIDMSDKHGIADNFEAICQVHGLTAFIGRSRTQVWSGTIPGQNGDFTWSSNVDVGVINGDLLVPFPNDVYFISQSGLQSYSTLNIARQFAATSSNAVDPIISKFLEDVTSSNMDYRACSAFKYEQGVIGGFKIGRNKVLISLFQTNFYSWSFFSGDFQSSNDFVDLGRALYLGIGNSLFKYADGNDGSSKLYGDQNGTAVISFAWIPGVVSFKKNTRFANKRYELVVDYPSEFPLNPINQVMLKINGRTPTIFEVSDECQFQERGDAIGDVPLGEMRFNNIYEFVNRRLRFKSTSFWMTLYGYVINGPLSFKKIRLFGVGERHA